MKNTIIMPYLAGTVMAVFFGLSFLMTRIGLAQMPAMVLISCRFGVAAVVLTLLRALRVIHVDYRGKPIKGILILSILYPGISFYFETVGLEYISSSQAGILVSMMPVFVTIFGAAILKERPGKKQMLFVVLSVVGVCITVIFAKNGDENSTFTGMIFILISVVGGALNNVLSRQNSKYFTPIEITYMMICTGAVIFTGIALVQGIFDRSILQAYAIPLQSVKVFLVVLELSVGTSIIAFFCMNYMLSKLRAASASVFFNLATVISIAAGILVLKERLHLYQVIGGAVILISVWGANYYEKSERHVRDIDHMK